MPTVLAERKEYSNRVIALSNKPLETAHILAVLAVLACFCQLLYMHFPNHRGSLTHTCTYCHELEQLRRISKHFIQQVNCEVQ